MPYTAWEVERFASYIAQVSQLYTRRCGSALAKHESYIISHRSPHKAIQTASSSPSRLKRSVVSHAGWRHAGTLNVDEVAIMCTPGNKGSNCPALHVIYLWDGVRWQSVGIRDQRW